MNSEAARRLTDALGSPDLHGRETWIVYSKEERIVAGLLAGVRVDGARLTLWLDAAIVVAPFPVPCQAREKGLMSLGDAFFEGSLDVRRADAEGIVVMRSFFGSETCLVVDSARAADRDWPYPSEACSWDPFGEPAGGGTFRVTDRKSR